MRRTGYRLSALSEQADIGTILHGAYGDYFEQIHCIRHLQVQNPSLRFHLFFANPYRMEEFEKLDLSFAVTRRLHTELEDAKIDRFYQFQVNDIELRVDILDQLSDSVLGKFDRKNNLLPHVYMRRFMFPNYRNFNISFTEQGLANIRDIERGLPPGFFSKRTVGFMWRYRSKSGAISPRFTRPAEDLREKYSLVLEEVADRWDCNVLVAGMNVETTEANKYYVDAKFPEYGLNVRNDRIHYLPGKGWLAEIELLSRCDVVVCNPSGFSEALFLKGKECLLVDPPLHYVLKTVKNGLPLFGIGARSTAQMLTTLRAGTRAHSAKYILSFLENSLNR